MSRYRGFADEYSFLADWADLKSDQGFDVSKDMQAVVNLIKKTRRKIEKLVPRELNIKEPAQLNAIKKLRPKGPRKMWDKIPVQEFRKKLKGARLGRCAANVLGAMVEFYPIDEMKRLAKIMKMNWPPEDYWPLADMPYRNRYGIEPKTAYSKKDMKYVPRDDDLIYTLLGLLIVEDYGPDFTIDELGKAWTKYLPYACTAERVALENLNKGVPAKKAGLKDNPYIEWIGGDIRSDPWGYVAPAWPEKAAELAWRDAYLTHRYSGMYGTMYFSAVIAAAFGCGDVDQALRLGLTEIPKDCRTAKAVKWSLGKKGITNWKKAREAVDKKFGAMSAVHTDNNLALTIFGLRIGKKNFAKAIGETVAMGMDNDCTAATVGSIFGAAYGIDAIPEYWYKPFRNKQRSYINKHEWWSISDTLKRFENCAREVYKKG